MEKKVLAFGASNSKTSINKRLATFASSQITSADAHVLDLNDFPLPLYSPDLEKAEGIPESAVSFLQEIKGSDGIIISLAEYNGLHTAAFKNLWDWMSRIDQMNIWYDKPMFLLSTSPSRRPESNVMRVSKQLFPHFGGNIISSFQLPSFHHYFKDGVIIESEYKQKFETERIRFQTILDQN